MKLNIDVDGVKLGLDTNILDVEVPAYLEIRVTSGIDWLDEALGGGFVPTQVVMLTGMPGAGKTTLALQLADSLMATGTICLYNSREESVPQIAKTVQRLGLQNGFVISQHLFLDDLLEHADKLAKREKKRVLIIQDSLPTLDDGFYRNKRGESVMNSRTPLRAIRGLTEWAKHTHNIVVVINHVTKNGQAAGKQEVKHTLDTHIHVEISKEDNSRQLYAEKNRMGDTSSRYVIGMSSSGLRLLNKIDMTPSAPVEEEEEQEEKPKKRRKKNHLRAA